MDGVADTSSECRAVADRATEETSALGVSRWRLLPSAVGVSHLKLLQVSDLRSLANIEHLRVAYLIVMPNEIRDVDWLKPPDESSL